MEELEVILKEKVEEINDILSECHSKIEDIAEEIGDFILDNNITIKTKSKRKEFINEIFQKVLDDEEFSAMFIKGEMNKIYKGVEEILEE